MLTKVFVYGTLMQGHGNARLLDGLAPDFEGIVKNVDMFDLFGFPGIRPGTGTVHGAVYDVDEATLANLDRLEGVEHGLYTRETVTVHGHDGSTTEAEAYFYARGVDRHYPLIESGDWGEWRNRTESWADTSAGLACLHDERA